MTLGRTYLDHNATSPLRPEAREAMMAALDVAGNASSVHAEGRRARALVEAAREQVAATAGAKPREIVFTSGGTEANNAVFKGAWDQLLVSSVEHDSVLASAKHTDAPLVVMPVRRDGVLDVAFVAAFLKRETSGFKRALLSVQVANNETGVVQPMAKLMALAREHGVAVHIDAVQAAGKVPLDFSQLGVDFMTLSAHKIGGPKGVGALVIRDGITLAPLLRGGGQELRQRAGTENVAGIAGFGKAAEMALAALPDMNSTRQLRDRLEREAMRIAPGAIVVAQAADRLPNTTCLALPGANAETLVIALDLAGIAVSAGAACSSGKVGRSPVLTAMGLTGGAHGEPDLSGSAIRISLGWNTKAGDIDAFLAAWAQIAPRQGAQAAQRLSIETRRAVA